MMEADAVYENAIYDDCMDTRGLQIQNNNNNGGKAKKGCVCLVVLTVSLGLVCVLLLVYIIWLSISITAERDLLKKYEDTVQEFKDSCRLFVPNEAKNWSEGRQYCRDRGADLVIIKTEEKQKFLSSLVKDTAWIGLNDIETEGLMKWVDNSPLNKSQGFFLDGEPNSAGDEDCVMMNFFPDGLKSWNDQSCSEKNKVICEK